jgi:hypothetical protein
MRAIMRRKQLLLLGAALGIAQVGCSEVAGPEAWAGGYQTATKFDGPDGVWETSGRLTITQDSSVTLNGTAIISAVFWGDSLAWEVAAGNSTSAFVVFKESDDRGHYWVAAVGECFTGWIQYPSGDPLDFRGLKE